MSEKKSFRQGSKELLSELYRPVTDQDRLHKWLTLMMLQFVTYMVYEVNSTMAKLCIFFSVVLIYPELKIKKPDSYVFKILVGFTVFNEVIAFIMKVMIWLKN